MASQPARSSDHRALPSWGRRCCGLGLLLLTLALATGIGGANVADAATTITVNTTSDETVTDGQCSLREAINNANANTDTTGGDCIAGSLGADMIDMSSLSGTITLSSNLPSINEDLTLTGPGASVLTVNAAGNDQVFTIDSGSVAISGLTMTGATITATGATFTTGSAVLNYGNLTVTDSSITGNRGRFGAGIASYGPELLVERSTITGNIAPNSGGGVLVQGGAATIRNSTIADNGGVNDFGGGIVNFVGTVTVENSTISGNSGGSTGGGIANSEGTLVVRNSTISSNSATFGGGIDNYFGTLTVTSSTITGNSAAPGAGGGIDSTSATLENTIVANQTAGGNCSRVVGDGGHNLEDANNCGFSTANGSLPNTDPLLDPAGLKDNGGPTPTIGLQPGSPAIDAIPPPVNGCGTTITIDQRGVTRPQGVGCDIGAFELVQPGADLAITKSVSPNAVVSGNRLTYTLTVNNNGPRNATEVTVTDPLPDSVHFNSVTQSQGTCVRSATTNPQPKGGTVACSMGNLANGASATITIVVTATTPGTLTNTATVTGKESDPSLGNNSATAITTVIGT
jgi:uncharacterized repeat protein (TIGR01451 family)/CSLREA domain-containing protein